jgi:hypothetical protein
MLHRLCGEIVGIDDIDRFLQITYRVISVISHVVTVSADVS